jgi:hypothetical protein
MNNFFKKFLGIILIVLVLVVFFLLIKAGFWLLLQVFNYPLQVLLISIVFICILYLSPEKK